MRQSLRSLRSVLTAAIAAGLAATAVHAATPCEAEIETPAPPGPASSEAAARRALAELVDRARTRSRAVGAVRLLAEAAEADLQETLAAARPQSTLTVGGAWSGNAAPGFETRSGAQASAAVNVAQTLYDGGRNERLADWRRHLLDATRLGLLEAQEQVALQAVALALERSRWQMHASVSRGRVAQMGCLVSALEQIVAADRGRASELAQARKTLGQALLQQEQDATARQQSEIRLARLVGPGLPEATDLLPALAAPPAPESLLAEAPRARPIAQLDAQARASESQAEALAAAQRPQLAWTASLGRTQGNGNPSAWSAGLSLNVALLDARTDPALAAAQRRAAAARLQRDDALESLRQRIAEAAAQMDGAQQRARRIGATLADSERVRSATRLQWQQLGRRSLFDVMSAETEHFGLRAAHADALHDARQAAALLWSLGPGVAAALEGPPPPTPSSTPSTTEKAP